MLLRSFTGHLKERYDDECFSNHFQQTVHLRGVRVEQEQLAAGDPGSGTG